MFGALGRLARGVFGTGNIAKAPGVFDKVRSFGSGIGGNVGGHIAAGAVGGLKGAGIGAGLWAATGNADWLPLMAGAGAWRGVAKNMIGPASTGKEFGWFNPNRLTRNMAIGSAVGLAKDDPNWGVYGALGLPAAGWLAKTTFNPRGSLTMLRGLSKAPFNPEGASRTLSKLTGFQPFASMGFMGLVAGGGYGAANLYNLAQNNYEPRENSVTSGFFPGGTMPLGAGAARGIPNNHLSTEGLTLALHKNAHKTRVI